MKKLILILFILVLGGCYNYHELNELGIVNAISIDKNEDNYIINVQIINTSKNDDTDFIIYEGIGKTIEDAFLNISSSLSKNIYLNSVKFIIINENLALNGIHNVLEYIKNNKEINKEFYLLISKNSNDEILKLIDKLENIDTKKMKEILKIDNEYYGISKMIPFEDILINYLDENKILSIPSIYIDNDNIKLGPMVIFNDDKIIHYLTNDDSLTYNILNNNIHTTFILINHDNEYMTIKLNNIKVKKKLNNKDINISIKLDIEVIESSYNGNIKSLVINDLNNRINSIINISKTYNIDLLNIKDLYYKYNNTYYNKLDKYYLNNINYNIVISIEGINNIKKIERNKYGKN